MNGIIGEQIRFVIQTIKEIRGQPPHNPETNLCGEQLKFAGEAIKEGKNKRSEHKASKANNSGGD